jgi:flotillin
MISLLLVGGLGVVGLGVIAAFSWYKIVPSSQAHLVISGTGTTGVYSADTKFRTENASSSYFAIPAFIPYFGRIIRPLDVTIKELKFEQETIEKEQARYMITSSTKYRVADVKKAAESFINNNELSAQLKEIIQAAVREVTVKYSIEKARAERQEVGDMIKASITDDVANWGVELVNFVLVDFSNVEGTTTVSDISLRREVEINTTTRQQNAEKVKVARMKEAEADEKAQEREIARDKVVAERKQQAAQGVSEKEKIAQEKAFEVIKVKTVKQAEITKEANIVKAEEDKKVAIVKAEQQKESESILKEQKLLEGQGDRLRAEEIAKGSAAPIREIGNAEADIIVKKLLAEAEGKDELQKALNKFGPDAITALTAELQIIANKEVGIAGAKAFEKADMKVFAGSDNGGGFDVGKTLAQIGVANNGLENAMLNKAARPQDLGFSSLKLKELNDSISDVTPLKKDESK